MASIQISTEVKSILFSSAIPSEINLSTDLATVGIAVSDGSSGHAVFSTTLDSYDGVVTLFDLRSVVEEYMRERNLSFMKMTLQAIESEQSNILWSATYSILYCSHRVSEDALSFAQNSFLTTLNSKLTHRSVAERLSYLICPGESQVERFSIVMSVNGGIPYAVSHSITIKQTIGSYSIVERAFDYDTLLTYTGVQGNVVIKAFTFSVGNRTFCFYYDDRVPNVVMAFRNAFNSFEVAVIHAETRQATKVDRSIATSNGSKSFYDQTTERTNEVETAGVNKSVADWFEQLVMSDDVRLCDGTTELSSCPKVMITDSTCEVSDTDEKLNTIKFKWQYEDALPYIPPRIENDKIFTEEFNNVYQ